MTGGGAQHEEQQGPGDETQAQQQAASAAGKLRPGKTVPGAVAVKAEPMADTDGEARWLGGPTDTAQHAEDGAPDQNLPVMSLWRPRYANKPMLMRSADLSYNTCIDETTVTLLQAPL